MMGSSVTPPEIDIALVGAAAFQRACKDANSEPIMLMAVHSEVSLRSSKVASDTPKPSFKIPDKYTDFSDVFDEIAADELPEHRPYDLKIELEEGASPPLGRLYPLSEKELKAL